MIIKNTQKGFIVQGIIAVVAIALIAGGAYYATTRKGTLPSTIDAIHPELVSKYPELIDDNYAKTKSELLMDNSTVCKNGSGTAVNYKYKAKKDPYAIGGDWIQIDVIDCGDVYWITDLSDSGPKLYGPFDLTKTSTSSTSDWKTYTDSINGYQIDYPSNWIVEKNLGVSVRFVNPERQGKPDTDIPVEAFGLGFNKSSCKNSEWKEGFGLIFYKSSCISVEKGLYASMSAGDENAKKIEDKILTSFKFISPSVTATTTASKSSTNHNCPEGTSWETDRCLVILPTVIPTPTIKVLSPNGGETVSNNKINFSWNTSKGAVYEPRSEFYASLIDESGKEIRINNQLSQKYPIANGVFSSSFSSIDNSLIGKKYKIKVCDEIELRKVSCDSSDNYFTITN